MSSDHPGEIKVSGEPLSLSSEHLNRVIHDLFSSYSPPVWATLIAGVFIVISLTLSMYLLFEHPSSYKNPEEQMFLIGVILMVPCYAVESVIMRKDSLDVSEFNYYKSLHNRSREQFDRLVQAGTLMNNYGHIFAMITRLWQATDHRNLVMYSRKELASGNKEAGDVEKLCDLCHDAVEDPVVTSCRHVFCKACLIGLAESVEKMPCPSCTKLLTFDFAANNDKGDSNSKPTVKGFRSSSILNGIQLDKFQTSTKIDALVHG